MISGTRLAVGPDAALVGLLSDRTVLLRDNTSLAVVAPAEGRFVVRRALAGLTYASVHGELVAVHRARARSLVRVDLAGDELPWPVAAELELVAATAGVALFSFAGTRVRVAIPSGRVLDTVRDDHRWSRFDASAGLAFGIHGTTLTALRVSDGAVAWTAQPITGVFDSVELVLAPWLGAIELRATARGKQQRSTLDVRDGRALRDATAALEPIAARYSSRRELLRMADGVVVVDDDQAVVVRSAGIARIALPYLMSPELLGNAIVGLAPIDGRHELVVAPLPADGDHDLELVPISVDSNPADEPGAVTFAGSTVVTVNHPIHGRVVVTRTINDPQVEVGTAIIMEGVTSSGGGGARASRWWRADAPPRRLVSVVKLGAARLAAPATVPPPLAIVGPLHARANAAGMQIPRDVTRLLALVEADAELRVAVAELGMHFEPDELGLDVLDELEIANFVPIWGNGYNDGFGGLTAPGTLAYLYRDVRVPAPLASIGDYLREQAASSELAATAAFVTDVLAREAL